MRPWSELPVFACGSAQHWARCRNTLRGCCPVRSWRVVARLAADDVDAGVAAAGGDCTFWASMSCRLRTPSVIQSSGTASPDSFMRVRRAFCIRRSLGAGPLRSAHLRMPLGAGLQIPVRSRVAAGLQYMSAQTLPSTPVHVQFGSRRTHKC